MKRGTFIQANISGKIQTGFVLYTRGNKVTCWFFNMITKEDRTIYVFEKEAVKEIARKDIPQCDFMKNVDSLMSNKGDFVSVNDNNKTIVGRLVNITADGYEVLSGRDKYSFDFWADIKLATPSQLVFDKDCPLADWDATIKFNNVVHHDGGYCKQITFLYKGKKAFVSDEDEVSNYDIGKSLIKVDGKDAPIALLESAKKAFIASGVKDKYMFFAESHECIGEYLLFSRGHKTLAECYNKI